jgi:hypothetical protein
MMNVYSLLLPHPSIKWYVPPDRMPQELGDKDPGFGWHMKGDNFHYYVIREPKLNHVHSSNECNLRTAWINTEEGSRNTEENINFTTLENPQKRFAS